MRITLTSVLVNDPVNAFRFYTEVLGFVEKLYLPQENLAIVASPEDPNGTSLLLEPTDRKPSKNYQESLFQAGMPILVLGVVDIQLEYEKLKELGVVFRKEPTKTEIGTQALFEDTCGNLVQLYQAAEK